MVKANLPVLGFAAFTMVGAPLQALAAVYLLRRFAKFDPALERVQDVWWFVVFAVALSPTISATIGATGLLQVGLTQWADFVHVWYHWWLGDAMGVLLIAPILLTCRGWLSAQWTPRHVDVKNQLIVDPHLGVVWRPRR